MTSPLTTVVSFGADITKPSCLETRSVGSLLNDIRGGAWREPVERVRLLPMDSREQQQAKRELPYCTWAGEFSRRSKNGLLRHSGLAGVDLDDLDDARCVRVIQRAVADPFCAAAFRSVRFTGVRLLFRIPPCTAKTHDLLFPQVAQHVQEIYGEKADPTGSDVSRASFISYDRNLWIRGDAELLPVSLPPACGRVHTDISGCHSLCALPVSGTLDSRPAYRLGALWAWSSLKEDGYVYTHGTLLRLGLACAVLAEKWGVSLNGTIIDDAFDGWWQTHQRRGHRLRSSRGEYLDELKIIAKDVVTKPWFRGAANHWSQWTHHPAFPVEGTPEDRLRFVIREHCDVAGREFFLSSRDVALVAKVSSYSYGARLLRRLLKRGFIALDKRRNRKRSRYQALHFRLVT